MQQSYVTDAPVPRPGEKLLERETWDIVNHGQLLHLSPSGESKAWTTLSGRLSGLLWSVLSSAGTRDDDEVQHLEWTQWLPD